MAILKHIASKNADYGEAQRYLIFQYDESTKKPLLDENGHLQPREEYYLDGINCDPFTFDTECMELNAAYHKNQNSLQSLNDFPTVIFRPTGVYGPRERDYFLMAKSIKQLSLIHILLQEGVQEVTVLLKSLLPYYFLDHFVMSAFL